MPQIPRLLGMNKRVLWLTLSNAAERSERIRTDDSLADLAAWSISVTAKKGTFCGMFHSESRLVRILEVVSTCLLLLYTLYAEYNPMSQHVLFTFTEFYYVTPDTLITPELCTGLLLGLLSCSGNYCPLCSPVILVCEGLIYFFAFSCSRELFMWHHGPGGTLFRFLVYRISCIWSKWHKRTDT